MAEDFLNFDFEDTYEPVAIPEGEYMVRVINAEVKSGQKGPFLILRLDVPEEPKAKDMTHVLMLPTENDDAKQANRRKLAIKRLLEATGIGLGGFSPEQLVGSTFYAYLVEEESEEYGTQNRIRRILTGA